MGDLVTAGANAEGELADGCRAERAAGVRAWIEESPAAERRRWGLATSSRRLQPARRRGQGGHAGAVARAAQRSDRSRYRRTPWAIVKRTGDASTHSCSKPETGKHPWAERFDKPGPTSHFEPGIDTPACLLGHPFMILSVSSVGGSIADAKNIDTANEGGESLAGWSQRRLAEASGVSAPTIKRLEIAAGRPGRTRRHGRTHRRRARGGRRRIHRRERRGPGREAAKGPRPRDHRARGSQRQQRRVRPE